MTIREDLLKGFKSAKGRCTSLEQISDVEKMVDMLLPIAEGIDNMKKELMDEIESQSNSVKRTTRLHS